MPQLLKPVTVMSHTNANLAMAFTRETGERMYMEFAGGHALVSDLEMLELAMKSKDRGDERPARFRILDTDDHLKAIISEARGKAPAVPDKPEFEETTLQESMKIVMLRNPKKKWTIDKMVDVVTGGGYVSKSQDFPSVVLQTFRVMRKKGLVENDRNRWSLRPEGH